MSEKKVFNREEQQQILQKINNDYYNVAESHDRAPGSLHNLFTEFGSFVNSSTDYSALTFQDLGKTQRNYLDLSTSEPSQSPQVSPLKPSSGK